MAAASISMSWRKFEHRTAIMVRRNLVPSLCSEMYRSDIGLSRRRKNDRSSTGKHLHLPESECFLQDQCSLHHILMGGSRFDVLRSAKWDGISLPFERLSIFLGDHASDRMGSCGSCSLWNRS